MPTEVRGSTTEPSADKPYSRWSLRLVSYVGALILVNAMADTVVKGPLIVLPQMLDHFNTDQAAWLKSSAMLAGAMWAPLLGKSADIYGKRRVLLLTLLIAGVGAAVCALAPNLWVFLIGRALQGAALASVFLSVALLRDVCPPRMAMPLVGVVTTGSSVLGIFFPSLFEYLAEEFDFRVVFAASAILAVAAGVCVRGLIPRSAVRTAGRIDVTGALILGGGLAATLSYISLGPEFGWLSIGPLALLGGGIAALARWYLVSSRKPEPAVDIRNLTLPLVITLLVVALAIGTTEAMDQLNSLIVQVSPELGLGYGLATDPGARGLLFGLPTIGAIVAGPVAGILAARIGPAVTLAGAVALGAVGTLGMFFGASNLYAAIFFTFLLSITVGALVTSGFNMATTLARPDQQAVVSSLIMVVVAIGSVVLSFVGSAVLTSTDVVVGGETMNSATGVYTYIAIATAAFAAAGALSFVLVRRQRRTTAAVSEPAEHSTAETP